MGSVISLSLAACIPLSYVGLLYVFDREGTDRNDPDSMRKRFTAAFVNNILALGFTYYTLACCNENPLDLMGLRIKGSLSAVCIPAFLTTLLYSGQWLMMYYDGQLVYCFSVQEWRRSIHQLTWIRDTVVAPITEEIAFRGCAAALMASCLSRTWTIFIAPLSFALSHLHHISDDMRKGKTLTEATTQRVFQGVYTYLFGTYATYLFLSTGHIVAPIITHAMCNNLGLPLFHEISNYTKKGQRFSLMFTYLAGILGFGYLVGPLTQRDYYLTL